MCSKVLNGHIILTDTSITTILAPEMTYTPNFSDFCNQQVLKTPGELKKEGYEEWCERRMKYWNSES